MIRVKNRAKAAELHLRLKEEESTFQDLATTFSEGVENLFHGLIGPVEFGKVHPKVRVTVGISGTGGGFKKFVKGETDINDASRLIKPSEIKKAKLNKIEYIELPVAYDGLSVVVNKDNNFLDYLTVEELNSIWKAKTK